MNTLQQKPLIKSLSIFLLFFVFAITGCSGSDDASDTTAKHDKTLPDDHFLKEKLETIKKAEEVEQIVQDAADKRRKIMEEQGG
ncbi:MAG: hypothetical protein COB30_016195 [Ectothiorhodospiraceae bacterium]|nr:hypothetical protein [Ectothiorhodospiraceae bacterium]